MTCPHTRKHAASKPVTNFLSLPWFEQTDLIVLRDARNSNIVIPSPSLIESLPGIWSRKSTFGTTIRILLSNIERGILSAKTVKSNQVATKI